MEAFRYLLLFVTVVTIMSPCVVADQDCSTTVDCGNGVAISFQYDQSTSSWGFFKSSMPNFVACIANVHDGCPFNMDYQIQYNHNTSSWMIEDDSLVSLIACTMTKLQWNRIVADILFDI